MRVDDTYEVEVVLDNVPLKRLKWQRPIAHGHDERVVDEAFPHISHVWSLEEVLDEVAPIPISTTSSIENKLG